MGEFTRKKKKVCMMCTGKTVDYKDPELRYTGNNTPVATFSLAVNRNFSNQQGEREADHVLLP